MFYGCEAPIPDTSASKGLLKGGSSQSRFFLFNLNFPPRGDGEFLHFVSGTQNEAVRWSQS